MKRSVINKVHFPLWKKHNKFLVYCLLDLLFCLDLWWTGDLLCYVRLWIWETMFNIRATPVTVFTVCSLSVLAFWLLPPLPFSFLLSSPSSIDRMVLLLYSFQSMPSPALPMPSYPGFPPASPSQFKLIPTNKKKIFPVYRYLLLPIICIFFPL